MRDYLTSSSAENVGCVLWALDTLNSKWHNLGAYPAE